MSLDSISFDLGNVLSYLTRRQEVIASNIANADTPGFKTKDVEMPGSFSATFADVAAGVVETSGLTSRNDGNNVSLDREARLLSENGLHFNVATQFLRARIKNLRLAIEEGRTS